MHDEHACMHAADCNPWAPPQYGVPNDAWNSGYVVRLGANATFVSHVPGILAMLETLSFLTSTSASASLQAAATDAATHAEDRDRESAQVDLGAWTASGVRLTHRSQLKLSCASSDSFFSVTPFTSTIITCEDGEWSSSAVICKSK